MSPGVGESVSPGVGKYGSYRVGQCASQWLGDFLCARDLADDNVWRRFSAKLRVWFAGTAIIKIDEKNLRSFL